MGTQKIDAVQTAQIATLEANINEIKTKINLMVDDVLAITSKVNTVIGDLNDMNDLIMRDYSLTPGYPVPPAPFDYGILQNIEQMQMKLAEHENTQEGQWGSSGSPHYLWELQGPYGFIVAHPLGAIPLHSTNRGDQSVVYDTGLIDGTDQGGNTTHTAGAEDSTAVAEYQGEKIRIMSVLRTKANRAKKLVRKTLNRLRK